MDKTKFGSYIKESRTKKNYTQQELADLLFVDVSTVSKWERGVSYPDITLVPDICRVLEISEHELIASSHDVEYRKIKKDANKYNNMKKGIFWILNISYLTAILVCFIVNVAVDNTLSWFFIVLTSLICAYTFCPTITWLFTKYKKPVFIGSTFISMSLLFFTCSMYTENYWFIIATLGVLLGYFIAFYPMTFKNLKKMLGEEKYDKISRWFLFSYILGVFSIVVLLLVSIYFYISFNLILAFLITGGIFVLPIAFGVLNLFEISKSLNKTVLLSLAGVLVVLILVVIGRSVYLKSTENTRIYIVEDTYSGVNIIGKDMKVNIYLSNNNENKVIYVDNKKVSFETKVIDGVLTVNQTDNRKFYDMLFNFTNFRVDLYLTEELIDSLNVKTSTGDVNVYEGFIFNNVDINNSTGDIEFKSNVGNDFNALNSMGDIEVVNVNVGGNLNIITKTGDVELTNVKCDKLDIKVSTGDAELENVLVNGDFNMSGSTGDLEFDGFDAHNIYVTLRTGDVEGTILTSKIFNVTSETGRVKVPETYSGGICKIRVGTGNINIRYR